MLRVWCVTVTPRGPLIPTLFRCCAWTTAIDGNLHPDSGKLCSASVPILLVRMYYVSNGNKYHLKADRRRNTNPVVKELLFV